MAQASDRVHQLPSKVEKILAAVSGYFAQTDRRHLQKLLVNSRYRVIEEVDYDNWDGGQWGHDIVLEVPAPIYFEVLDNLGDVRRDLKDSMNRVASYPHEYVSDVRLELADDRSLENWREESGLVLHSTSLKTPSVDDLDRIWRPRFLRLFFSHKSTFKVQTADLKKGLARFGISCFVAHEDIEPTKEWQDEIEKALFSMHVLVALMTDDFHDSSWTDQEVGIAIGRGIPVISVRLGTDPYGFIGKYQAIPGRDCTTVQLSDSLLEVLISKSELHDVVIEGLVSRLETSESYQQSNELIKALDRTVTGATSELIERLDVAAKRNSQVGNAWDFPSFLARLRRVSGSTDESPTDW